MPAMKSLEQPHPHNKRKRKQRMQRIKIDVAAPLIGRATGHPAERFEPDKQALVFFALLKHTSRPLGPASTSALPADAALPHCDEAPARAHYARRSTQPTREAPSPPRADAMRGPPDAAAPRSAPTRTSAPSTTPQSCSPTAVPLAAPSQMQMSATEPPHATDAKLAPPTAEPA
eukprot:2748352-Prymnesium_polylepis.1